MYPPGDNDFPNRKIAETSPIASVDGWLILVCFWVPAHLFEILVRENTKEKYWEELDFHKFSQNSTLKFSYFFQRGGQVPKSTPKLTKHLLRLLVKFQRFFGLGSYCLGRRKWCIFRFTVQSVVLTGFI